jgi:predicted phosphodiesterase
LNDVTKFHHIRREFILKNIGEINGKALIFGGPYSNDEAVRELKETARSMNLAPHQIICTGDTVAYCARAQETVEILRDWGIHVITGNVEVQLFTGENSCGCGFGKGSACDLLSQRWYEYTRKSLSSDSLEWMGTLPEFLQFEMGGRKIRIVHGGLDHISEHIFHSTSWESKQRQIEKAGADMIIGGHCGLPFIDGNDHKAWINAGVIGMPANDGTSRVWYLVLSEEENGLSCELCPMEYNFENTARTMEQADLPEEYVKNIRSGLWPDMTQLPDAEKKAQGVPLSFEPWIF